VPLLEVADLRLHYLGPRGVVRAVDGVSLELEAGEVLALVGESGSGKSSLALALLRLLPRNTALFAGRVRLGDLDLTALSEEAFRREVRGRRMALVPQGGRGLNPVLRVGEQLVERLLLEGLPRKEAWRQAAGLLARVGLGEEVMGRYPFELSGGMRQRVLLAMALVLRPAILLLDEPTSALDVSLQAQVVRLLKAVRQEFGLSLLFITHDLALAAQVADRLAVLYAGQLVEVGPLEAVLAAPAHPYTQGLLASLPSLRGASFPRALEGVPPDPLAPPPGCPFHPRCPAAFALCREALPPLVPVSGRQWARCWLHTSSSSAPPRVFLPEKAPPPLRPPGEPLLRLEGVRVHFWARKGLFGGERVRAVEGVSLTLHRAETLALVGESGSGKTTLGRASLRLVPLAGGRVVFAGQDLTHLPESSLKAFRRRAQAVFQDPYAALSPFMPVGALVEEPLRVHGLSPRERRSRVLEALERVGLYPASRFLDRFPHTLSGGQRQRVALARALVLGPEYLVADEPVSMVDASARASLLALLREIQEERGLALLYITHDLATARFLAHRVAVMYLGRLVEVAPTPRLLQNPLHPYTQALLEAVPELGRRDQPLPLEGEPPSPSHPPPGCPFHPRCPRFLPGVCEVAEPPWAEVEAGHWVACHLYPPRGGAPGRNG
jgi:peptide/nickel transport system ATP-binding protein